ncbi:MAG: hypothetical protein ACR2N1_15540 [Rubripirellula sp.]
MNINDSQSFTDQLAKMSPASSGMDPRRVFYEAGFKAGGNENTASTNSRPTSLIAACLMTLALAAPASFYAGANQAATSSTTDRLVEQPVGQLPDQQSQEKANAASTPSYPLDAITPNDAPDRDSDLKPAPAIPAGNDVGPILVNQNPLTRELGQWAQTLFPYQERNPMVASNQHNLSTLSIGHGTSLSHSEDAVTMLDGAISANLRKNASLRNSENINTFPQFAPTPSALLKYFNSLETIQ